MSGTLSEAVTVPNATPLLNNPVASARSSGGKSSVTTLRAAGKFAASPMPRPKRATPNPNGVRASACAASASDHQTTETARPRRAPMRSSTRPDSAIDTAYASWNALTMRL